MPSSSMMAVNAPTASSQVGASSHHLPTPENITRDSSMTGKDRRRSSLLTACGRSTNVLTSLASWGTPLSWMAAVGEPVSSTLAARGEALGEALIPSTVVVGVSLLLVRGLENTSISSEGVGDLASRNKRVIGEPCNKNINMAPLPPWHIAETWRDYRAQQVMGTSPQMRNISRGGPVAILGHTTKICGEVLTVKTSRRKITDIIKYSLSELNDIFKSFYDNTCSQEDDVF
mmetsp:Transcript_2439/g.5181  ORF Transcript_2439/g.5181 Transcript_2439/m.5181 type:complete len:231 (-) Transcript_2439:64-756(-)